jgi:hypothetical protein
MRRSTKLALGLAVPALLVCVAATQLMCRDRGGGGGAPVDARSGGDAPDPDAIVATAPPTTVPAGPAGVRVSVRMVIHKKYNFMARVAGNKDSTVTDAPYAEGKSWWDNPMLVFQDASFRKTRATAGDDSATITGGGSSANVAVDLTLVPHADVTLNTLAASDCVKGTLTARITTISDYYDREWTRVTDTRDAPIAFAFDTSDPKRPLRPTTQEAREIPPFSFERYTRDRQKWEPRSAWPANPESGDWRCTIEVKDVKLAMTGYQYADTAAAATTQGATTKEKG